MSWRVLVARSAEKDLSALPPAVQELVLSCLKKLAADPHPPGCKKLAGTSFNWRLRVRDYRLLYAVDGKNKAIRVYRVKHRSAAYR